MQISNHYYALPSGPQPARREWCFSACQRLAIVVYALSCTGCADKAFHLETASVTGTVTLDGKPVTEGVVLFTPARGKLARGALSEDGTFTLSTYKDGDGAIVGTHQVAVISRLESDAATFEKPLAPGQQLFKWIVPERYANGATSGLVFEVKPGVENHPTFELQSKEKR
jgi:hypothetical protein